MRAIINHRLIFLSVVAAMVMGFTGSVPATTTESPNILIIFTDDEGYADLGCYGNTKNRTPRMDQLAKEGLRFTSFYAQAVCGPSRAALLTGRYPFRSGGWNMPGEEVTFAEVLKEDGYQTACIGKWDVSSRKPIIERMPNAQGFDYYFGPLGANDRGELDFYENNKPAGSTRDMARLLTRYTDKAIDFLKNKRDPKKPFVLYLAHSMMHMNIDASERFKGKSDGGLYGDVVEEFDYEAGRLLDTLDELKLRDNTLVIYTSDNGPWNQKSYRDRKIKEKGADQYAGKIFWGDAGPLRNGKGSCYEGGYRLPCIVRWPGRVPAGQVSDAIFSTIDFLPTFVALAGGKTPTDRIIDGVNQTDLLLGKNKKGARDTFYYQGNGLRYGNWKYLKAQQTVPRDAKDVDRPVAEELYDLDVDIGEKHNLAAKYPKKVAELRKMLSTYMEPLVKGRKSVGAVVDTDAQESYGQ
jgi:arylsulfatase A-like enzyme